MLAVKVFLLGFCPVCTSVSGDIVVGFMLKKRKDKRKENLWFTVGHTHIGFKCKCFAWFLDWLWIYSDPDQDKQVAEGEWMN